MKQGSVKKPASLLAIAGLAAAGALALFALNPSGSVSAASLDDSQRLTPQVFNQEAPPGGPWDDDDDCDRNGPPGFNGNDDDCDRDRDDDDCDWWDNDRNGPPSRGGRDDCDRDDDRDHDDCDRDWDRNGPPSRGGRDDCDRDDDRDHDDCDRDRDRDRRDRDDDCRDRDRDRDHDDCDDDHDRRDRDHHDDDCDEDSTITIIKDSSPSSSETFSFGGDLGSFVLRDGQSRSFRVDSGTYSVWENDENGWSLESIDCSGDGVVTRQGDGVRIRVSEDDRVTCIFNNEGADEPVKVVSPAVAPQPQIVYVPVPAPQPVARPVEVVREPAPAPRPAAPVASLPRTGQGLGFQQEGNLALPLGALAALSIAGFGYLAVRRVRDTD